MKWVRDMELELFDFLANLNEQCCNPGFWNNLDFQERLTRLAISKNGLKHLLSSVINRRYLLPAKLQNKYFDVLQIQGSDGAIALHSTSNLWHPSWDNGQDDFLYFVAGLKCGFQTRYLEPELFTLLEETDVPVNLDFDDIKMPFPALRIMVPKGHYATDSGGEMAQLVSFAIAYIEPGTYEFPEPLKTEVDTFYKALIHTFQLGETDFCYGLKVEVPLLICLIRAINKAGQPRIVTISAQSVQELRSNNHPFQSFFRLALNAALFMVNVPKDGVAVEDKFVSSRKVKGNGTVIPELWQARFVGDSFNIPPLPAPMLSSKERREPSYHLRPHWRRGHWKRVGYGSKHSLRRLQWIYPTVVNWYKDEEKAA
jgi:hypothetical protein